MSGRKIEIGDVFNWFSSAIQLALKNPGVFVVMALIYAVIFRPYRCSTWRSS